MLSPLIAIAEDELDILDMLELLLTMHGYRTVSTRTAATVSDLIHEHHPALLILDIRMEHHESGWQVLDMLRADPVLGPLPVIMCSAEHDIVWSMRQRDDAAMTCVQKPFAPPQLLATIHHMLNNMPGGGERTVADHASPSQLGAGRSSLPRSSHRWPLPCHTV